MSDILPFHPADTNLVQPGTEVATYSMDRLADLGEAVISVSVDRDGTIVATHETGDRDEPFVDRVIGQADPGLVDVVNGVLDAALAKQQRPGAANLSGGKLKLLGLRRSQGPLALCYFDLESGGQIGTNAVIPEAGAPSIEAGKQQALPTTPGS